MSIAKKADLLPVWTEAKGVSGYYGPNSVVYYQKTPDVAGYAYKAKSTYISSNIPPDEDSNWEIDYTYSTKWVSTGKYKLGSRVYHFNGQYTYAYVATRRYFGGSGKPNEEVDDDGIRTWELEANYIQNSYYWYYQPFYSHLFPVRKIGGYNEGSRAWPWNPMWPEERYDGRYTSDPSSGIQSPVNPSLDGYLYTNNLIKKDYSDINSKYQSYAYDNRTYNFYEDKMNSNNEYPHRKKGIHFAKWRKETTALWYETPENPNPYKNAVSQFAHTLRSGGYYYVPDYYDNHGYSIEIWPNIQEDEYSTTVSTSSNSYYYNPSDMGISYGADVLFGSREGYMNNQGIGLMGPYTNPNSGVFVQSSPPDEECKVNLAFYRQSPAFSDLNCKYCFNTETQRYKWTPVARYVLDSNGNAVFDGYDYFDEADGEISYGFFNASTTTKDEDFKSNEEYLFLHYPKNFKTGNAIDLSNRKPNGHCYVGIGFAGWKID